MKVEGAVNPIIERAPTADEDARGVKLAIRPPSPEDVARIWHEAHDKMQFFGELVTRRDRMLGLDIEQQTPSTRAVLETLAALRPGAANLHHALTTARPQ